MKKEKSSAMGTPYTFEGRIPLKQAIPLGLQHVMAMFIGNLTPLLIIMGACGLTADAGYGALRTALLQNAMTVAGIVTLVQMFSIGPIGGKVPIVMGTSSGFLGVFKSVTAVLGQGALTYGAILGATIVGGLFEGVLGICLKPLRKFFPSVVTGCVVMAIGLSLIPVGINYLCGGSGTNDYGSIQNLFLGMVVLIVTLALKHFTNPKGILSTASILIGILVGYVVAIIMTMVLPHTGTAVLEDGSTVSYTYSWVVNFQQVKDASWFALPGIAGFGKLAEVKPVFRVEAILPVAIMFIVTTVETVGDICACVESGMDREATDSELSGGIICDGLGSSFAAALGVLPNTSFAQNVGIISMTKIVNRMALSCGAIFLILMGVINLRIPASYIVTFAVFMLLFGGHGFDGSYLTAQLCGGGLMLGAFFMATDYVTSPITPMGQIIFGICCGILTGLFRCFGANAEGVSFAIILSNILVPLIEKHTVPMAFGQVKEAKKQEGGK